MISRLGWAGDCRWKERSVQWHVSAPAQHAFLFGDPRVTQSLISARSGALHTPRPGTPSGAAKRADCSNDVHGMLAGASSDRLKRTEECQCGSPCPPGSVFHTPGCMLGARHRNLCWVAAHKPDCCGLLPTCPLDGLQRPAREEPRERGSPQPAGAWSCRRYSRTRADSGSRWAGPHWSPQRPTAARSLYVLAALSAAAQSLRSELASLPDHREGWPMGERTLPAPCPSSYRHHRACVCSGSQVKESTFCRCSPVFLLEGTWCPELPLRKLSSYPNPSGARTLPSRSGLLSISPLVETSNI
ncbi:hypothetical protein BDZ91DRAFT_208405 [Kalaharituber pfeilii]|nr:hypothetical protein BDZ91DRAFT_208405 [Kalaharituber pfeilii]